MSARDRSLLLEWLRTELVGPCLPGHHPKHRVKVIHDDGIDLGREEGLTDFQPVFYRPAEEHPLEEIVCFPQETPKGKYGIGLLYPEKEQVVELRDEPEAGEAGADEGDAIVPGAGEEVHDEEEEPDEEEAGGQVGDDLDLTPQDRFQQGTMGMSFFARFAADGTLVVRFPRERRFVWQQQDAHPFPQNGWYRRIRRRLAQAGEKGQTREFDAWARCPAMPPDNAIRIPTAELRDREILRRDVPVAAGCPLNLRLELIPRKESHDERGDSWLITVVLRNRTPDDGHIPPASRILFQSYFEVSPEKGTLLPYPESRLVSEAQDDDERSLALLYSDFATWGVGHGCAAGWDGEPGRTPDSLYADVMPAVETPSMTPDIKDAGGKPVSVSMRELMDLPPWSAGATGTAWDRLEAIVEGYAHWITQSAQTSSGLPSHHQATAEGHLLECNRALTRMRAGLTRLRNDGRAHRAFRLANQAMLLQQLATKVIDRRPLTYDPTAHQVRPAGAYDAPARRLAEGTYDATRIGTWRAFQIAFLLMSLEGCADEAGEDRAIVDLIWFPTGGGKTEAYLGVAAFLMFYQRLLQAHQGAGELPRDGTNVLMRYTLRMLTTQQFQRAASLICAMDYMRRQLAARGDATLGTTPFSLGLWIGREGAPNSNAQAQERITNYRGAADRQRGNPLVLTECPWCRAQIGRYSHNDDDTHPQGWPGNATQWREERVRGVVQFQNAWRLRCPDTTCPFNAGGDEIIPVQVIDEVIYAEPPSMLIGTADKFAMLAYLPEARSLFGLGQQGPNVVREKLPPALIIQDELHLISGPLGTLFGLYEGVIEALCSHRQSRSTIRPKIICSTATIRGANDQVRSLFAREKLSLFPAPGLGIADSYFGTFARKKDGGGLDHGRLYVGLHTSNLPSVQTAQVRVFSRVTQAVAGCLPANDLIPNTTDAQRRDPWWTLLVFYNSLRELGGARTLFEGDIRSRTGFLQRRDGTEARYLNLSELSGRLLQDEIVGALDRLSVRYQQPLPTPAPIDVALASNIIEVGVDVDRLSLIGIVGQPKTTAQYIQVTGRVGRRWWERPGLVMMLYNPSKARDRSHFEQFHSYHRRLYERVEPTSVTPFSASAVERALVGAVLTFVRQTSRSGQVPTPATYLDALDRAVALLRERCEAVEQQDRDHALATIDRVAAAFRQLWQATPHDRWHSWNLADGMWPLMRPFDQYATAAQRGRSAPVPTSLRQVDRSGELQITQINPFR